MVLGGEEFIIMPEVGLPEATQVAECLRRDVAESRMSPREAPEGVRMTVSIGVAQSAAEMGATDLISAADARLYEAKQAGRDRVAPPP